MISTRKFNQYRYDFSVAAEECLKIVTKRAELVPFKFNRMQRVLYARLKEQIEKGEPVRWYVLKARQLGSSTFFTGFLYWLMAFRPNRNCLLASHDDTSASNLYEKIRMYYTHHPAEIRPVYRIFNREQLILADPNPNSDVGLNSQLVVQSARNSQMGRSFSLHGVLLSEFAFYPDPKSVLISVKNAMPKTAGTFLFIETTANGDNYAKQIWDDEASEYEKIFISWLADDEYRLELKASQYWGLTSFEHDVYGNEEVESERIRKELIKWYPEESKDEDWMDHEVMCRLAWRRRTIDTQCERDLNLFNQEYPTIPEQAFMYSGKSVFGSAILRKLADWRNHLKETPPTMRKLRYSNGRFLKAEYGNVRVYEPLYDKSSYVIGCDPAEGVEGGDCTGIVVFRLPEMVQCCVFSDVIPPNQAAELIVNLANFYNGAFVGVEANDKGGYDINRRLWSQYKYTNIYRRLTSYETAYADQTYKLGWRTTSITKPIMITDLRNALENNELTIFDDEVLRQIMAYQKFDNGKMGCPYPLHDDLVSATAIAVQMAKNVSLRKNYEATNPYRYGTLEWFAKKYDKHGDLQTVRWGV